MNIKRHIFNFIADHQARYNYLPTQADIRQAFSGLTDDADLHLEQLEREGLLALDRTGDGTLSIPRTFPPARRIELRGFSGSRSVSTSDLLAQHSVGLDLNGVGVALDGDLFAQVAGDDSMADAGIAPGDVAILKVISPERGDIVAVEEKGQLILRRYIVVAGIPHFLAENPSRPDLTPAHDKPIHGVLWCLVCTRPSGRSRSAPPIKQVNYQRDGGLTLESEFVAMLKSELKKGSRPTGPENERACPTIPQEKKSRGETTAMQKLAKDGSKWAKPPSGISLNDKAKPGYQGARQRLICDEKPGSPYGSDFVKVLTQFATQTEQATETR